MRETVEVKKKYIKCVGVAFEVNLHKVRGSLFAYIWVSLVSGWLIVMPGRSTSSLFVNTCIEKLASFPCMHNTNKTKV